MIEDKKIRKERIKLQRDLKGHYSDIARELNLSVATISRVLQGDFENDLVIKTCIEKRIKLIQEKQNLYSKI